MFDLTPAILISRVLVLLVAFAVHEFAHAWTADYFGDLTPRRQGRLTLNPIAHLDLMGSLMLLFVGFGWAKPVQINPHALRRHSPAAEMLVALAGPVSNLMLAIVGAFPFQLGLLQPQGSQGTFFPTPAQFLNEFIVINLLLLFFNMIPLFPLDGEKVLLYFAPPNVRDVMLRLRQYGMIILLALVFFVPYLFRIDILGLLLFTPMRFFYRLLVL